MFGSRELQGCHSWENWDRQTDAVKERRKKEGEKDRLKSESSANELNEAEPSTVEAPSWPAAANSCRTLSDTPLRGLQNGCQSWVVTALRLSTIKVLHSASPIAAFAAQAGRWTVIIIADPIDCLLEPVRLMLQ